jgi:serine protease Do
MKYLFPVLLVLASCAPKFDAKREGASVVALLGFGGGGTGFVVQAPSGKSFILTNRHVCEADVLAVAEERLGYSFLVEVVEISEKSDLCLIKAGPLSRGLALAEKMPEQMDPIHIVGYGLLMGKTYTNGHYVGRIGSGLGVRNPAYATASILPGNSGSPVFNEEGLVVGVAFASHPDLDNRVVMVPLEDIKEFLGKY